MLDELKPPTVEALKALCRHVLAHKQAWSSLVDTIGALQGLNSPLARLAMDRFGLELTLERAWDFIGNDATLYHELDEGQPSPAASEMIRNVLHRKFGRKKAELPEATKQAILAYLGERLALLKEANAFMHAMPPTYERRDKSLNEIQKWTKDTQKFAGLIRDHEVNG